VREAKKQGRKHFRLQKFRGSLDRKLIHNQIFKFRETVRRQPEKYSRAWKPRTKLRVMSAPAAKSSFVLPCRNLLDESKHPAFVKLARAGRPLLAVLERTADDIDAARHRRRNPAIEAPHGRTIQRERNVFDFHDGGSNAAKARQWFSSYALTMRLISAAAQDERSFSRSAPVPGLVPTRPTCLGVLEISEAESAWPSTAASDRGLGRPVAGRGRARGCKTQPSLIWIKAVGIEDGNYETVTIRMQPSIIVWDLETVPDLAGFAASGAFIL
jgi:hypothetical protein